MKMRATVLTLTLLLGLALAGYEGPFSGEPSTDIIKIGKKKLEKYVLTKSRNNPVVLFVTVPQPEIGRCHHCGTVDPIFTRMAYNYNEQFRQRSENGTAKPEERLYFARLEYSGDTAIPQLLGLRNIPSIIVFPPKTNRNFVRFEDDPGRATENKKLEESLSPALTKKKKLEKEKRKSDDGKKGKAGKKNAKRRNDNEQKWHARMARREKQWNNFALEHLPRTDDGTYNEHNLLRFLKRNTGIDLQLTSSPPESIKAQKVFSLLIATFIFVAAAYVRLAYYPAPDPNTLAKDAQLRARGVDPDKKWTRDELADHPLVPVPNDKLLPKPLWTFLFLLSAAGFLVLQGGFYYNVINPSPWKGDGKKGALIMNAMRGQYGIECYLVAGVGFATNVCFLLLITSTKIKNPTIRAGLAIASLFGFLLSLGLFWAFFLKKNPWFLGSGKYRDYLVKWSGLIGKLLVGEL
eukprot:TRINITY_DN82085_c0_g1_i1.p1 TRINITY_DN82085_c0_g1~~TRINITY_DN82085_c0_g1_i1.p1  ORF type:complete len:463 (-),score=111.48 TRINITY_DN82085_c0_g1_i1:26-1414(-)